MLDLWLSQLIITFYRSLTFVKSTRKRTSTYSRMYSFFATISKHIHCSHQNWRIPLQSMSTVYLHVHHFVLCLLYSEIFAWQGPHLTFVAGASNGNFFGSNRKSRYAFVALWPDTFFWWNLKTWCNSQNREKWCQNYVSWLHHVGLKFSKT